MERLQEEERAATAGESAQSPQLFHFAGTHGRLN